MNNILYSICKLRTHFMDSADTQNELIQFLSGNSTETIPNGSICDGLGNQFNIEKLSDTRLKISQVVNDNKEQIRDIFTGNVEEWSHIINDYTGGVSDVNTASLVEAHFSNFLLESSKGEQTNELFATLLDKYTTNSRSKASDLNDIIDASGLSSIDIKQLKTAISTSSDGEGYVSGYALLSLLRNLGEDSKEQLSNDKISMDDSKIFYLSNFLASAFSTIASTLVSIVGLLLSAINTILGLIVSAIGFILNIVGQAFSHIDDAAKIQVSDPLSFVPWFDGPAIAKVLNFRNPSLTTSSSILSSDVVKVKEEGPFSTCLWKTNDTSMSINRFLGLNVHLDRFATWMFSKIHCNVVYNSGPFNDDIDYEVTVVRLGEGPNPFDIPESVYLTDEERIEILGNTTDYINDYIYSTYLIWNAYVVYCSMVKMNYSSTASLNYRVSNGTRDGSFTYKMFKYADEYQKYFAKRLLGLGVIAKWYHDHGNYLANGSNVDLTELIIGDFNQFSSYSTYNDMYGLISEQGFMERHTADNIRFELRAIPIDHCYYDSIACYTNLDTYFKTLNWYNSLGEDNTLSNIPKDRMFKFAKYDQNKLIQAMVVIGIVTTVVLVAGTIAIKQFKKMKFKRQYDRKSAVQAAKEAYDDEPTKDNFKALYKAQKSYNFKAKLFGWESYDVSNDWFDAGEDAIADTDSNTALKLDEIINLIR